MKNDLVVDRAERRERKDIQRDETPLQKLNEITSLIRLAESSLKSPALTTEEIEKTLLRCKEERYDLNNQNNWPAGFHQNRVGQMHFLIENINQVVSRLQELNEKITSLQKKNENVFRDSKAMIPVSQPSSSKKSLPHDILPCIFQFLDTKSLANSWICISLLIKNRNRLTDIKDYFYPYIQQISIDSVMFFPNKKDVILIRDNFVLPLGHQDSKKLDVKQDTKQPDIKNQQLTLSKLSQHYRLWAHQYSSDQVSQFKRIVEGKDGEVTAVNKGCKNVCTKFIFAL